MTVLNYELTDNLFKTDSLIIGQKRPFCIINKNARKIGFHLEKRRVTSA
jgi:hypothetical protein